MMYSELSDLNKLTQKIWTLLTSGNDQRSSRSRFGLNWIKTTWIALVQNYLTVRGVRCFRIGGYKILRAKCVKIFRTTPKYLQTPTILC